MLLFEKLLLAVAIPMQIFNILVKDRFLIKTEIFPILLETYVNFTGADLALTKKFWHVRTTRKGIALNHSSGYSPDAAHPPQIQEEMLQGIAGIHSIYALPAGTWPEPVLVATAFKNCCLQNFYVQYSILQSFKSSKMNSYYSLWDAKPEKGSIGYAS